MKFSSLKVLSLLSAGLFFAGCEPHSFEETQVLHGDHGHHEGGHGEGHAEEHGEKAHAEDHGKVEAKGEAKEAHAAPAAEPRKTGL